MPATALPPMGTVLAIYGKPGSGKTTFCCEASRLGPTMMLDIDGGAASVQGWPDLNVMLDLSWKDVKDYTDYTAGLPGTLPYTTYVLDNLSELQARNERAVAGRMKEGADARQIWRASTQEMLALVRKWKDIAQRRNVNVLFAIWDKKRKDKEGEDEDTAESITRTRVGFTPALADTFPGIIDHVGLLRVMGSGRRLLSFEANDLTDAKFRRSRNSNARKIPLKFSYGEDDAPIVDIIRTLRGDTEWPAAKYERKLRQAADAADSKPGTAPVDAVTTAHKEDNL